MVAFWSVPESLLAVISSQLSIPGVTITRLWRMRVTSSTGYSEPNGRVIVTPGIDNDDEITASNDSAGNSTRAMLNQEVNKMTSGSRFTFSLPWGPVVNQFGPGSAFYHTRIMRKLRAAGPKTKQVGHLRFLSDWTGSGSFVAGSPSQTEKFDTENFGALISPLFIMHPMHRHPSNRYEEGVPNPNPPSDPVAVHLPPRPAIIRRPKAVFDKS
ncbi:unnamed protein product [Schistocephalus solidus]|uniref:Capsid protein n=1 Tax=Schistocephalus solidus TaxID=70667 RepID=A0A183SKV0_SCHSO|nr:unnamed protein product [Schistocephalus solidus]